MPSERASSSLNESTLIRHRHSTSHRSPNVHMGTAYTRSRYETALSPPRDKDVVVGKCAYGSDINVCHDMEDARKAVSVTPARTRTGTGSWRRTGQAVMYTAATASKPQTKALACPASAGKPPKKAS